MSWNTDQWKCYIYNGMAFRLIFPKSYTTAADGKKYPVLVFFHGAGEAGVVTDNEISLAHGGNTAFQPNINNGKWDGFILVPQTTEVYWTDVQVTQVKQILDYMVTNNKADPFHMIANGLSAGGSADWVAIQNYPQVFCGAPIFSANNQGNASPTNIPKTKFLAVWDFQGGLDSWPSPWDAGIVNTLMGLNGANYKYTIYPDLGHGTWDRGWAEPDFWPFCNRAYGANPWPLHGQVQFCPGVTPRDTIGVAPGFDAYQWRKNGVAIAGNSNWIIVTDYGTYDCRVQRNGIWSDWSRTPVVIAVKPPTVTPTITVQGLASNVLPALDATSVTLQLPDGYASYVWQKVGSSTTIGTTSTLTVSTPGQYRAQVTETGGCSSSFGTPFTVVPANGANAPDAASGVQAAPLGQTSVLLNWNQNPSPAYNETAFEIYQASKSGGPYKLIAITGADVSTDTIAGLNAGTKYFWVIRAVNGNGAAATSNEASTTTSADTQAPTAPGDLSITASTYNGISLTWTAATDNVGVAAYDIYVNGTRLYSVPLDQTNFTVYSLNNGTSYTFVVKARDQAGNSSVASNQVSGEPLINGLRYSYFAGFPAYTTLPDFNSIIPETVGMVSTFSLSPKEDADHFGFLFDGFIIAPTTGTYQFQTTSRDGSKLYLGTAGSKASAYTSTATPIVSNDHLNSSRSVSSSNVTLQAGQIYPIAATFMCIAGSSSLTVSWKTPGKSSFTAIPASAFVQSSINNGSVPAAPSNLVATALSYKAIGLQWKDNANNETGYEIYRSTSPDITTAAIIGNAPAGATTFTDSTAAASTKYYYFIDAINQYGASQMTTNYREVRFQFNNTIIDSSGNGHTITPTGTVTYDATNKQEGAASLKLNGSNQAETMNTTGGFLQNAFSQRTVALWIKPASYGSNRVIFDIGGSTNGLALVMNNNTLTAAVASGGTRTNVTYSYGNSTTVWHHVAVVYLGDTLQLYVDGNLVASNNALSFHSVGSTTDGARLGQTNGTCALNNAGGIFSGNIDDFGVYTAAFGSDVIAILKNNQPFLQSFATTQALPAVPTAPTTLVATATSSAGVRLTWVDNSTNETNFQVYRSNNNNQNYVLMATLPAGSTSFQDSGLFANATYYYKVDASGIGGQSAFTNEANATTPGIVPVITPIANLQARYGITTVIPVKAVSSGAITLSASNLPGFAVLTDNHDGTGKITLNPTSSDAGNYTGLTVTATGSGGGASSTSFDLAINNNYPPTLDSIANYTMNEGDSLNVSLHGANVNPADVLTLAISNLPGFYTLNQTNGTGTLTLKPGYAAAGSYVATVTVNDNNGLSTSRTFNLTVADKSPTTKIYARVKYQATAPAPWNNMTGTSTPNLKDQNGNTTPVSVSFSPSSWWLPYNAGATTGNNSGVYPDVVMQEFYYFAFFDGPATASFTISGLDTSKSYDLNIFASSSLPGPSPDNGITSYTIGSTTQQLAVQGNTRNTANFSLVKPASNGTITVNMAKLTSYSPGYLNAFVIANHFDDGTAPAPPTGLTAALAGKAVGLTWVDHAYNDNSYQVFRSAGDTLNFTQMATLSAGATSYTDTSIRGGIVYYYKVNASNTVGSSDYSNIASVTSADRVPTVTPIATVVANNGQTTTVNVTAADDASDHLTLTAGNLPSFASFVDNGNGTGTITITPPANTQGIFQNVTITATDMSDSSASTSFSISVVDPNISYTYVDITTPNYQSPAPWNNLTAGYIPYAGTAFPNLKDQSGANSGITITLTDAWTQVAETGMKRRNGSDVFPESVLAGSFYATDNNVHRITLTGLNPAKAYNFLFFASHFVSESTLTNFTAGGQTISLDGSQNSNKTAQLNGITPDANGTVVISCQKASAAKFAMLSALVIESYTPGSAAPIAPADLRVLDFRKTGTVPLQWQDRASNETGYEVWRAPHGGSYSLLKTLPANSTTYTDSALAADVAYDYTVRAKGATTNSAYSNPVLGYTYANSVYIFLNRIWAPPYNFPTAPTPFNNTNWIYQALNTEWDNFKDENGQPTNVGMLQPTEWDEVDPFGASTGNNSGVYPDLAMGQGWLDFPGTVSYVTITGLDVSKVYDFTVFGSCTDAPNNNASGMYTINGQTGILNAHYNTSGTLTFFNVAPDAFGNVNIGLRSYDSTAASFAVLGNIAVKGHTPAVGGVSTAPASTVVSNVATATANNLTLATTSNTADVKPLEAFPNPFNDFFNLSVPATSGDNVLVTLTDVNGRTLYTQRFENLFDGTNVLRIQPNAALPTGAYFVKVIYTNRGEQKVIQLLKNKK
ncbi:MAG TPA: fibronectin type III domain-containing protein [Puia sp.]|nr:fibronectin type III domain-containing protein [Puia sp.]